MLFVDVSLLQEKKKKKKKKKKNKKKKKQKQKQKKTDVATTATHFNDHTHAVESAEHDMNDGVCAPE